MKLAIAVMAATFAAPACVSTLRYDPRSVTPGSRVLVGTRDGARPLPATVEVGDDGVVWRSEKTGRLIPTASIAWVEETPETCLWEAALLGMSAGVIAGALVGFAEYEPEPLAPCSIEDCGWFRIDPGRAPGLVGGGLAGGLLGGLVGASIGASISKTVRYEMPLPFAPAMSAAVGAKGAGLVAAWSF